jgi:NodT family efflux transporter outer membrane factor (OMF) lipoprotein
MKTFALTILTLALAGCAAVGPDFKAPVAQAPLDWSDWHGGAGALRAHGLAEGEQPAFAWFADPVLASLQRQALAANHDLKTATLHFAQSRRQRNVTASAEGPQLQARAGAARQAQSEAGTATRMVGIIVPAAGPELADALAQPFNVFQAGFDASWELDLWGRVRRSIEAADASVAERAASLRQVQLSVAIEVARNYLELRAAQRQWQLADDDIRTAAEVLELTTARRAAGLATELDVARDTAELAALRAGAPLLLEQETRAINQLTLLTGAHPGALQSQLAAISQAPDAPFGNTPDMALGIAADLAARRPDIQMAEARLHAATASIGIAKADLYPRITLGASLGTEALDGGRFGEWGSRQWSIGPSLSLPLFDRGRRRATVELRELQQQEAAVNYQHTVLRAWTEVDNSLSAYAAQRLRRTQWLAREASSAEAFALATARHQKGMTDAVPVLEAQRALIKARRDRIGSEAEMSLRLLTICKAVGIAPQS